MKNDYTTKFYILAEDLDYLEFLKDAAEESCFGKQSVAFKTKNDQFTLDELINDAELSIAYNEKFDKIDLKQFFNDKDL